MAFITDIRVKLQVLYYLKVCACLTEHACAALVLEQKSILKSPPNCLSASNPSPLETNKYQGNYDWLMPIHLVSS
jgi:hypothetical protein